MRPLLPSCPSLLPLADPPHASLPYLALALRHLAVSKHSGLLVGRQLAAPVAQAGLSSSFGDDIGGVPHSSADSILADRSSGSSDGTAQAQGDGATPMVLRRREKRQVDSGALEGGAGDPSAFSPSDFIASLERNGSTSSSLAPGAASPGPDGIVLAQPLRAPESSSAPQQGEAHAPKGVQRRSPGWIVRVLRIVSVQWDGRNDDDDEEAGEGEGCEEGEEVRSGVDDGPQGCVALSLSRSRVLNVVECET